MRVKFENETNRIEKFDKIFETALHVAGQNNENIVVSCMITSADNIKKINKEYRNIDKETDVLSFPLLDDLPGLEINEGNYPFDVDYDTGEILLGDIVICEEVARKQAEEFGHSYERELCYLFTHGVFHLLGYDHESEEDKAVMREKEEAVLNALNITRD